MFAPDPDASATSEELSDNSETYDFLMVYMPLIRPKEPDSDEEAPAPKEPKAKKGAKGKKGLKKQAKSFVAPDLGNALVSIAAGDGSMPMQRAMSSQDRVP